MINKSQIKAEISNLRAAESLVQSVYDSHPLALDREPDDNDRELVSLLISAQFLIRLASDRLKGIFKDD